MIQNRYITLLLLLNTLRLFTADTYPVEYSVSDFYNNSRIIYSQETERFFQVKDDWANFSEYIYTWKKELPHSRNAFSFENTRFYESIPFADGLLSVIEQEGILFLEHIDEKLNSRFRLHIDSSQAENKVDLIRIGDNYLILVNSRLLLLDTLSGFNLMSIDNNVSTVISLSNDSLSIAYLKNFESNQLLIILDDIFNKSSVARYDLVSSTKLLSGENELIMLKDLGNQTYYFTTSYKNETLNKGWLNSKFSNVALYSGKLCGIENDKNGKFLTFVNSLNPNEFSKNKLPEYLSEPMALIPSNDTLYAVFRNGLVSFNLDLEAISFDLVDFSELDGNTMSLESIDGLLIIQNGSNAITLQKKPNPYWRIYKYYSESGKFVIPGLLGFVALVLFQLYRHQKRVLQTLIELPASGLVLHIDNKGKLIRLNQHAKELLSIKENVPLGRQYSYYFKIKYTKPVQNVLDKAFESRENFTQKINVFLNGDSKEWLCNVVAIRNITGNFRGLIFTGIDITEELAKNRLYNWAQLAHDMQTNLSTIRLNAERIESEEIPELKSMKKKILHQVDILIKRIRDIVTVGRSDELRYENVFAPDICKEVRNEFDDTMFPNVDFIVQTSSFNLECDRPKVVRAIRNAVENGIKALKGENGTIELSCSNDSKNAYFSVKDNGVGIEESQRKRILTPYFTTSSTKGGTGIGTMIMQHVVELHGGKIIINSEKGKGTEVTFIFPLKGGKS